MAKTIEERIAVMQAFADGKNVQCQSNSGGNWIAPDIQNNPLWNWGTNDYRVEPEPEPEPEGVIHIGDVVQLKSGGPKMTVYQVESVAISCVWFKKWDDVEAPLHAKFNRQSLTLVKRSI